MLVGRTIQWVLSEWLSGGFRCGAMVDHGDLKEARDLRCSSQGLLAEYLVAFVGLPRPGRGPTARTVHVHTCPGIGFAIHLPTNRAHVHYSVWYGLHDKDIVLYRVSREGSSSVHNASLPKESTQSGRVVERGGCSIEARSIPSRGIEAIHGSPALRLRGGRELHRAIVTLGCGSKNSVGRVYPEMQAPEKHDGSTLEHAARLEAPTAGTCTVQFMPDDSTHRSASAQLRFEASELGWGGECALWPRSPPPARHLLSTLPCRPANNTT
ncbi:hypothetical protein QBC37DRAFT_400916 [Rhypophila decipiens]|uniref:Uncharacterized protein n=1 Tax=Rhypophila decipiens TaxID=261697 RepID=A0AAN6Y5L0_9PEZI|nr:hypothetical protein QBC37DRAFT_400916 [Rhypophila decipiens]